MEFGYCFGVRERNLYSEQLVWACVLSGSNMSTGIPHFSMVEENKGKCVEHLVSQQGQVKFANHNINTSHGIMCY